MNTCVTSQMIDQMRPDVVVLAVGGAVPPLNVPGADRSIVLDRENVEGLLGGRPVRKNGLGMRVLSYFASVLAKYFYNPSVLRWLLRFHFPFKKNVVILGGNYGGCELAETLVNRGKEVTIIEESGRIGADIGIIHRWLFMKNLREAGVRMVTDVKLLEVTNKGVKISLAGSPQFIQADTVIKVGITTNAKLSQELEGKVPFLYSIGDCKEQGMLLEAVASGFLAGQKI